MTRESLIDELEPLAHADRMRRMAYVGRQRGSDASIASTLESLERGGFYERMLALQSCYGSRDGAHVLRSVEDPSRFIRRVAMRLVPLCCDNEQALEALHQLSPGVRKDALGLLRSQKRTVVIDAFLETLAAQRSPQFESFLALGSPEFVARHLAAGLPNAGTVEWRRLARYQPEAAALHLTRQAEALEAADPVLLSLINAALPLLANRRPDLVLPLVRAALRHFSVAELNLQRLGERRPNEVAELLLASDDHPKFRLSNVAHRLEEDRLLALWERHNETVYEYDKWLERLPPHRRGEIYSAIWRGFADETGQINPWVIALLPADMREREARRNMALPALSTQPAVRLPYAAFLPWDEMREILAPYLNHSDADVRATVLTTYAEAALFQRSRLSDVLALFHSRKNEQDPVRAMMLNSLNELPPGIWREHHLAELSHIFRDALNATDLSDASSLSMTELAGSLVPFHPDWSADWLAILAREKGSLLSFRLLENRLNDADVRRLAPVLLPVFQSWNHRERYANLYSAGRLFGRRLRAFDGLTELLVDMVRQEVNPSMSEGALGLLAEHRRDLLPTLIPELVAQDESWITRRVVYIYLHRHRQDLLTPFLGQRTFKGRFSTGRLRFVLPLDTGFSRWTPRQQEVYSHTLDDALAERSDGDVREIPFLLQIIYRYPALLSVAPTTLLRRVADERPVVRDAALQALGGLDTAQGVPTLIEALGDDRARIAIYALRRPLLELPSGAALALLRQAPMDRVTVAKEVVRLIGDLKTEDAFAELMRLDGQALHRDVRIALLRALWNFREQPETWDALERAATDTDESLALAAAGVPSDRLTPEARSQLLALLLKLLNHSSMTVLLRTTERLGLRPVSDPDRTLLPLLLEALRSKNQEISKAAANAILKLYSSERDAPSIGAALASLLPHRRALHTLVTDLTYTALRKRGQLGPLVHATLDALSTDPLTVSFRVKLAFFSLPWVEVADYIVQCTASGELHAEALLAAIHALHKGTSHHFRPRTDVKELAVLEAKLAQSPDERLRRIALAALIALGNSRHGWTDELLSRLRAYRNDPSAMVAAAAQFTLPPVEFAGEEKNY